MNDSEKEKVIENLFDSFFTKSIKEINEKNYKLIKRLRKYENELNDCYNITNTYLNEALKYKLKTHKIRKKLRIHLYSVFNDGHKEKNYSSDISYNNLNYVYKYISPSTFTFNIQGYILNINEKKKKNENNIKDNNKINELNINDNNKINEFNINDNNKINKFNINDDNNNKINKFNKNDDNNNNNNNEVINNENELSEKDSINYSNDYNDVSDCDEEIDHYNTKLMKFTSFFSTIMIIRDNETIIYDKKHKNDFDCDKITFTRIVNEKKNEKIKVLFFIDNKIPLFQVSNKLKIFLNSSEETLYEIMKKIYEYSLKNNLINNSYLMKTDQVLKEFLNADEYKFSDLPKLLKQHIFTQQPIILEHFMDICNRDESETIYDMIFDTFEPYLYFENENFKNIIINSTYLNELTHLKNNEHIKENNIEKDNIKENDITNNTLFFNEEHEFKNDKDIKEFTLNTFEKINQLKIEIDDVNEEIINILHKIKQKNNLRLHYKFFYENPISFLDYIMNSKCVNDVDIMNNINNIYEKSVHFNDNDYYKLPWIHKGISNYLLIRDKNFDDILNCFDLNETLEDNIYNINENIYNNNEDIYNKNENISNGHMHFENFNENKTNFNVNNYNTYMDQHNKKKVTKCVYNSFNNTSNNYKNISHDKYTKNNSNDNLIYNINQSEHIKNIELNHNNINNFNMTYPLNLNNLNNIDNKNNINEYDIYKNNINDTN